MTTHEPEVVAAEFNISRAQVIRYAHHGLWPHLRVGKSYGFTDEHIEQIRAICEVPVRTPAAEADVWGRVTRGSRAS